MVFFNIYLVSVFLKKKRWNVGEYNNFFSLFLEVGFLLFID